MLRESQLLLDVRDVGKSVDSTNQDIQLLLSSDASSDSDHLQRVKHAKDLVDNIISLLTLFTALDRVNLDRGDELLTEVKRIEFSCFGLKSILSQSIDNVSLFSEHKKQIKKFSQIINESANRLVTISLVAKEPLVSEVQDVCYKNKLTCEQHCDGSCYQDVCTENSACPEYTEVFTESALTHVESGIEEKENGYWHKPEPPTDITDGHSRLHLSDLSSEIEIPTHQALNNSSESENNTEDFNANYTADGNPQMHLFENQDSLRDSQNESDIHATNAIQETETLGHLEVSKETTDFSNNNSVNEKANLISDIMETVSDDVNSTTESVNLDNESILNSTESPTNPTNDAPIYTTEHPSLDDEHREQYADPTLHEETTKLEENTSEIEFTIETSTYSYYDSYTSEFSSTYDTTTESTTETPYTMEDVTTQSYETTTQDLYKFSQDIYSVAQDLSTKSNEISSMTSDVSSKISNINSIMSDINSYDDDELSKKVQSVNKLTQDMNSKTSEISSLCSSMSSLSSDISSASSDMPSADRSNVLRTSPWQKISTKGQELVAAAQAVVSASQEILQKTDAVLATTSGMVVGPQVAIIGYDITAKTQLVISETLGLVSAVIDLINVVDS